MKTTLKLMVLALLSAPLFLACKKSEKKPPVDLNKTSQLEIPYQEVNGVKMIPVRLNGMSVDMIFDTGSSGMSISLHELQKMQQNGQFKAGDIRGVTAASIADGSVVQTAVVNLREVEIGGANGLILKNVKAHVMVNDNAPLLLGNEGVLDEMATVEIDNIKKTIKFNLH
ncbi:MAG: retroviral-like aspartic protease family protein [Bacteroidaceae bacterium]|nr:retroviral-like aspartic protease family protein [Bacteroidaceae bacterium]